MKSLLQGFAVTAALGLAASAQAQTVLKFGYAVAKDSHYGVGAGVFCAKIEKEHAGPLQVPGVSQRLARR